VWCELCTDDKVKVSSSLPSSTMRCRLPAAAAEPVLSKSLSEVTVATELDELMPLSAEPDTSATHDDCKETE